MKSKLGLIGDNKNDLKLINSLLNWMEKSKADYTNTFCYLMDMSIKDEIYKDRNFIDWMNLWKKRSTLINSNKEKQTEIMRKVNPLVIPRNHKVEEALTEANKGNLNKMIDLLQVLKTPYDKHDKILEYQMPASISNKKYQTFCGT